MPDHAPTTQMSPRAHRPLQRAAALGCGLIVAATLMGCGSSSPSSSSATTAATPTTYPADKAEICQARDQLKTSITALTDSSLLTKGGAAITAAVSQVKNDLVGVKTAAKQDYQPQIQALQTSVDDLQAAVGNLGSGSVAQNMTAVGTALATVGTDASTLLTELTTTCD